MAWSWSAKKPDGQDLDPVLLNGRDFGLAIHLHGLGLLLGHVKHGGHTGAVNVRIHQADFVAELGQCHGQIRRHRALSDTTFARGDRNDVLDAWKHFAGLQGALLLLQRHHLDSAVDRRSKRPFEGKLHRLFHPLARVHGGVA